MHNSWLVKVNLNTWESATVKELFYVKGRIGWRGLRRSQFTNHGPYLITGMHISEGKVQWDDCFHISEDKFQESPEIIVEVGDIIITKDGTIGKVAYIDYLPGPTSLNSHLFLVRPKVNRVDRRFAYHVFTSWLFNQHINDHRTGSTLSGLSEKLFLRFNLPLPSLQEQRLITNILDTVDTQIQHTEQLIAKLKLQQTGLLRDLLTYGLNKHRQLRSSITHSEQFKNSVIGRIPRDWEIKQLKTLVSSPITDFGSFSMTNLLDFRNSGIPFLRTEAIQDNGIDKSQVTFISEMVHKQLPQSVVHSGDLLFTKIGTIGRVCVYDGSLGECNSNAASAKIRLDRSKVNPYFVAYYLRSDSVKRQYLREIISIPPRINLGQINNWNIPVPTLSEQNYIVAALDSFDTDIRTEEIHRDKLKLYKKSLMQDLLMGHIGEKVLSREGISCKE